MNLESTLNWRYWIYSRKFFVLAVACFLLTIVLALLVIVPQVSGSLANWEDIGTKRTLVTRLEEKAGQLQQVSSTELFRQAANINQAFPSHKPLLEMLSTLQAVSSQARVSFADVSLSPGKIASEAAVAQTLLSDKKIAKTSAKKEERFDTLELKLRTLGSLSAIQRFMQLIENTAPLTTVSGLSLQPKTRGNNLSTTDTGEQLFEAELTLTSYFFTQSVKATLSAPLPQVSGKQQEVINQIKQFSFIPIQERTRIQGGGSEDLFGVEKIQFLP